MRNCSCQFTHRSALQLRIDLGYYVTLQAWAGTGALNLASKSTDKNSLPSSLKELMHATTFDDSAAGESGQSQNYKNYSAAVG